VKGWHFISSDIYPGSLGAVSGELMTRLQAKICVERPENGL